jgi:hypothetical protein
MGQILVRDLPTWIGKQLAWWTRNSHIAPIRQFLSSFLRGMIGQRYAEVFIGEASLPKFSPLYGMVVKSFMVSPITSIGGHRWQLRSVKNLKKEQWILLPFVIDTGGDSNAPIFSNGATRCMFGCDRVVIRECRNYLQIPLPLQDFPKPFMRDWDTATDSKIDDDIRSNLIGYEVAEGIIAVHLLHSSVFYANPREIHMSLEKYKLRGSTEEKVKDEIIALECFRSSSDILDLARQAGFDD